MANFHNHSPEEVSEGEVAFDVARDEVAIDDDEMVETFTQLLVLEETAVDCVEVDTGRYNSNPTLEGGGGGGGRGRE